MAGEGFHASAASAKDMVSTLHAISNGKKDQTALVIATDASERGWASM